MIISEKASDGQVKPLETGLESASGEGKPRIRQPRKLSAGSERGVDGVFRADKLLGMMKIRGFNRASLARTMGLSYTTIRRWVDGGGVPTISQYFMLSEVLRCKSWIYLLDLGRLRAQFNMERLGYRLLADGDEDGDVAGTGPAGDVDIMEQALDVDSEIKKKESDLFARFPIIQGVSFPSTFVSHPLLAETTHEGFRLTFEASVQRRYAKALHERYQDRYPPLDSPLRSEMVMEHRGDIWVYVESGEVYRWEFWDILEGVDILVETRDGGRNPSVNSWYDNLLVDESWGWRKKLYGVGEAEWSEYREWVSHRDLGGGESRDTGSDRLFTPGDEREI